MIAPDNATLLRLTGGVRLKQRVQHPRVQECRDRAAPYWYFRYWSDELLPNGTVKVHRKRQIIGPSQGPSAIGKKKAEAERESKRAKAGKRKNKIVEIGTTNTAA